MTKEQILAQYLKPSQSLVEDIVKIKGDILLLGAGGKMGPAMAKLAKEAIDIANISKNVIAVSRFSDDEVYNDLNKLGINTIKANLLDSNDLNKLPEIENVIYLAGNKFGTTGNESYTWAMNTFLPGTVAQKYKSSNIVVFSTKSLTNSSS